MRTRYDVEYRDPTDEDDGWRYYDNGGDTLSTAERRAKEAARRHEQISRVLADDVEVSRFAPDRTLKSRARRVPIR